MLENLGAVLILIFSGWNFFVRPCKSFSAAILAVPAFS
jgi:hypothetical protein